LRYKIEISKSRAEKHDVSFHRKKKQVVLKKFLILYAIATSYSELSSWRQVDVPLSKPMENKPKILFLILS